MIAHRLHTITQADKILVVENGTVVEEGRHAELLRRNGRYAAFYRLQLEKSESQADGHSASAATEMLSPPADASRRTPRMAARS